MRLSRFGYYTDFVAYPIAAVILTGVDFSRPTHHTGQWLAAVALGLLAWTLLEYVLHRIVLHKLPVFSLMHALHHRAPPAFVGTPPWVSIPVWCVMLLLPLWVVCGHNIALGTTIGVMLGYWWYGIVHRVVHRRARHRSFVYFEWQRAWHMRHHSSPARGNFGVTTALWDHVFGTALLSRDATPLVAGKSKIG